MPFLSYHFTLITSPILFSLFPFTSHASIHLRKNTLTPMQQMHAYAETGAYMTQKYFGSVHRKIKTDEANQIFGLDAEGKPSYGVPLSNYMNAQVSTSILTRSM